MDEQHRNAEEIDHPHTVHEAPDSRVGPHEEGVPALEEAVHQKQKTDAHGGGPRVSIGVCVVLCEALRSRKKHTRRATSLLKNRKPKGLLLIVNSMMSPPNRPVTLETCCQSDCILLYYCCACYFCMYLMNVCIHLLTRLGFIFCKTSLACHGMWCSVSGKRASINK